MLNYIEYLGIPAGIALVLVAIFFCCKMLKESLELKSKVTPEYSRIKKQMARKKQEKEAISKLPELLETFQQVPNTLQKVMTLLNEVNSHYSRDNITMRDEWIKSVNSQLKENDNCMKELERKLDKNNADTLSLLIDNKRNFIIDFATKYADLTCPATREQYNRFFKVHKEYEQLIAENGITNGEVDIAYRITEESYEERMKQHAFIEDVRGY